MINGRKLVELSHDIQSELGKYRCTDFESENYRYGCYLSYTLERELEIEYEILKKISITTFPIPSYALKETHYFG